MEPEDALAESIIDTMPGQLLVLDAGLRVVRASRGLYRAFAVNPEETEGRLIYELGGRQWDIPRVRELLEDILPRQTAFRDFEVEHDFERVGRKVVLLNARKVHGERPGDERALLVIEDATERLGAERAGEALRQSEERFRRYFELGLIGMAITAPDKGIVEVNEEICRILDYPRDELLRKSWAELTHPDDVAADVSRFARVMAGEIDGYVLDKRWARKDGRVIDATISVKCVGDAAGAVDYFVALLQDVTDERRARDELEERVAARTAELARANDALRAEARERERAERDRTDLLRRLTPAQEDERRRVARDLHDHAGQQVTALALGLQAARDPGATAKALAGLQRAAEQVARDVHDVALRLRPAALDERGSKPAPLSTTSGPRPTSGTPTGPRRPSRWPAVASGR